MDAGLVANVRGKDAEAGALDDAFVPDYVMLDFGGDLKVGQEEPPRPGKEDAREDDA